MSKIGRNDPCYCGSGKKYKKCCLTKDENAGQKKQLRNEKVSKIEHSIFISKPFVICPKCEKKEFGVLMITGNNYTRRCCACYHDEVFKLPPIKKRLIYLDQFVISNITKSLDRSNESHKRAIADQFWLEVYKRLDRLSKYQLLICPDSFFHRYESLVGKNFPKMKRIYEHLSNGTTFYDKDTINRFQINEHFQNYLDKKTDTPLTLDAGHIMHGRFNEWYGKIRVGIKSCARDNEINKIRHDRESSYEIFKKIFDRWRTEKGKKFNEWVMEEASGFGKGVRQNFIAFAERKLEVSQKHLQIKQVNLNDVLPPMSNYILEDMMLHLRDRKIEDGEAFKKINDYFDSDYILQVPSIKISSMLFAAIARKAAAGQVKPPSRGVFTDVNAIASFLPYCDAIFIDNENAAYLKESPLKDEIKFSTKIFSINTKTEFLNYLDSILDEASPNHLELVKKVYGEDWGEPYLTILE
jgi:hypothetical protein